MNSLPAIIPKLSAAICSENWERPSSHRASSMSKSLLRPAKCSSERRPAINSRSSHVTSENRAAATDGNRGSAESGPVRRSAYLLNGDRRSKTSTPRRSSGAMNCLTRNRLDGTLQPEVSAVTLILLRSPLFGLITDCITSSPAKGKQSRHSACCQHNKHHPECITQAVQRADVWHCQPQRRYAHGYRQNEKPRR